MQQVWEEIAGTLSRDQKDSTLWATAAVSLPALLSEDGASDGTLSTVDDFVLSDEEAPEEHAAEAAVPQSAPRGRYPPSDSKGEYAKASDPAGGGTKRKEPSETLSDSDEMELTDDEGTTQAPKKRGSAKPSGARKQNRKRKEREPAADAEERARREAEKAENTAFYTAIESIVAHIHRCEMAGTTKEAAKTYELALQEAQKGLQKDQNDARVVYENNMWYETTMYLMRMFGTWWRRHNVDVDVGLVQKRLAALSKRDKKYLESDAMHLMAATYATVVFALYRPEGRELRTQLLADAQCVKQLRLLWDKDRWPDVVETHAQFDYATSVRVEDGKVHMEEDAMKLLCAIFLQDREQRRSKGKLAAVSETVASELIQGIVCLLVLVAKHKPASEGGRDVLTDTARLFLATHLGTSGKRKKPLTLDALLNGGGILPDYVRLYLKISSERWEDRGAPVEDKVRFVSNKRRTVPAWWVLLQTQAEEPDQAEQTVQHTQTIVCEALKTLVTMAGKAMDSFVGSMASVMLDKLMLMPAQAGGEGAATADAVNHLAGMHATMADEAARLLHRGEQKLCTVLPLVDGGGVQWQVTIDYKDMAESKLENATVATLLHEMTRSDAFGFHGSSKNKGRSAVLNDVVQLPTLPADTAVGEWPGVDTFLPSLTASCIHVASAMHLANEAHKRATDRHVDNEQVTFCIFELMGGAGVFRKLPARFTGENLPWYWHETIEWSKVEDSVQGAVVGRINGFANQEMYNTIKGDEEHPAAMHYRAAWTRTVDKVVIDGEFGIFYDCSVQETFEALMATGFLPRVKRQHTTEENKFVLVASMYALRCISIALASLGKSYANTSAAHVGKDMFEEFMTKSETFVAAANDLQMQKKVQQETQTMCRRLDVRIAVDFVVTATLVAFSRDMDVLRQTCSGGVNAALKHKASDEPSPISAHLARMEQATQTIAKEVTKQAASFANARQFVTTNERVCTDKFRQQVLKGDPFRVLCRAEPVAPSAAMDMRAHLLPCTPPSLEISTMEQTTGLSAEAYDNRDKVVDQLNDVGAWRVVHVHGTNALTTRVPPKALPEYSVAWQMLPVHHLSPVFEGLLIDLAVSGAAQCPQIKTPLDEGEQLVTVCAILLHSLQYRLKKFKIDANNTVLRHAAALLQTRGVEDASASLVKRLQSLTRSEFCEHYADDDKRTQVTTAAQRLFATRDDEACTVFLKSLAAMCGLQGFMKQDSSGSVQTDMGALTGLQLNDSHERMQELVANDIATALEHPQTQIGTGTGRPRAVTEAVRECEVLVKFKAQFAIEMQTRYAAAARAQRVRRLQRDQDTDEELDSEPQWLGTVDKLMTDATTPTLTYDELMLLVLLRGRPLCPLGPSWQNVWEEYCLPLPATYATLVSDLVTDVFAPGIAHQLSLTGAAQLVSGEDTSLRTLAGGNVVAYSGSYYARNGSTARPTAKSHDSAMRYLQVRSLTTPVSSVARKGNKTHFDAASRATCAISTNRNVFMHECTRYTRTPLYRALLKNDDMLWRCTLGHRVLSGLHGLEKPLQARHEELLSKGFASLTTAAAALLRRARPPSGAELPYIDEVLAKYDELQSHANLREFNSRRYRNEGVGNRTMLTFAIAVAFCAENVRSTRPYDHSVPAYFRPGQMVNPPTQPDAELGLRRTNLTLKELADRVTEWAAIEAVRWILSLTAAYEVAHSNADGFVPLPDTELGLLRGSMEAFFLDGWVSAPRDATILLKPTLQRATMSWWHFCRDALDCRNLRVRISAYNENERTIPSFDGSAAVKYRSVACKETSPEGMAAAVRHELLEEHDYLWERTAYQPQYINRPLPSLRSRYLMADALHASTTNEQARAPPYKSARRPAADEAIQQSAGEQLDARYYTAHKTRLLQNQFEYPTTMGDAYLSALHGWRAAVVELSPEFLHMAYQWNMTQHGAAPLHYFASTVVARQCVGRKNSSLQPEFLCV